MTAGISRGVCAPPGTPADRIAVLEKAFDKVCRSKDFVGKMEEMGFEVNHLNAAQFKAYVDAKKKEYTALLRKMKLLK
jgi:tripartite-type tricarboxylate transporter receptor subunit TctC